MMPQKESPVEWTCRKAGTCDIYYNHRTGKFSQSRPTSESTGDIIEVPHSPAAPLRVYLDPTYRCNLSCRHCMTNSSASHHTPDQLPEERVLSILAELADIGVLEVAITGGEPLCYPRIVPLVNHAAQLGLNCILTTNGVLINEHIAAQLKRAGIFEMKVSFEGGRAQNDSIRGVGGYDRALGGLRCLKDQGINASVRLTLHRGSENGLEGLFSDLAEVNVTKVKAAVVKPIGRAALPENGNLLGFEASQKTVDRIRDMGLHHGITIHFSSDDFPFPPEAINDDKLRSQERCNCGAGFETAYISPSGDVMPCSSIPDVILGNIAEANFLAIWDGERTRQYRQAAERCTKQRLCCCQDIRGGPSQ